MTYSKFVIFGNDLSDHGRSGPMPGLLLVARIALPEIDEQVPGKVDDGHIQLAFVEAGEILVITPGAAFGAAARKGGAEGARLTIAIVPGNATINVPMR